MKKRSKTAVMVVSLFVLLSCAKERGPELSILPQKPMIGDFITVRYRIPGEGYLLVKFTVPDLVYDSVVVDRVQGKGAKRYFVPDQSENISVKLIGKENERELGPIPLFDKNGKPVRETYYNIAQDKLFGGGIWGTPDKDSAIFYLHQELKFYPDFRRAKALLFTLTVESDSALGQLIDTLKDRVLAFWIADAKDDYKKMLEIRPGVTDKMESVDRKYALMDLAVAAYFSKEKELSRSYFEKLIEEFPNFQDGYLYFGFLFGPPNLEDKEKLKEAKKIWERYLDVVKNDYLNLYSNYAEILLKLGEVEEAESLTRYALSEMNDEYFLKRSGFYSREIREKAKRRELANAHQSLAWILKKKGDFKEAERELREAISLTPDESKSYIFPGLIAIVSKSKDTMKLIETYREYYPYAPDPDSVYQIARDLYVKKKGSEKGFDEFFKVKLQRKEAPDFEVTSLDGRILKLSDLRGKVVVINFWATSCRPCKREIPELNEVVKSFEGDTTVFFMAISPEGKKTIRKFLQKNEFDYRIFCRGKGAFELYKVIGIPTHVIVDPEGKIFKRFIGFSPDIKERLKANIKKLLEEMKEEKVSAR